MELYGERVGGDEGGSIDTVPDFSRQSEEGTVGRHLADEGGSGSMGEAPVLEENGIEGGCVRMVDWLR